MNDDAFFRFLETLPENPRIMEQPKYERPNDITVLMTDGGIPMPVHTEVLLDEENGGYK